ncbi:MAG: hypothetical protein OEY51_14515, partial [Cyclobacteriaceae bacterium]|nr:hypothetical protein [Cyclobacteriaceae bacterium]
MHHKIIYSLSGVLLLALVSCEPGNKANTPSVQESPVKEQQSNNIRNYLSRVATELTDNSLTGINSKEDLESSRAANFKDFTEMISLMDMPMEGER